MRGSSSFSDLKYVISEKYPYSTTFSCVSGYDWNQIGITWVEFSFFVVIYTYDTCENKLELGHTGRVLVLYLSVDVIWDKN